MSEKRFGFEMDKNCYKCIVDIRDKKLYTDKKQVVDLLNDLNDECDFLEIENEALEDGATKYAELYHKSLKENEKLKAICKDHRDHAIDFKADCVRLEKENEQLKSEIEKLSYANEDLLEEKRIWKQMSDEYTKLSDENEELKQSVNNLKDTIVTIGIAYQKKYGRTLVDLVDGTLEEDIIDLIN